MAISTKESCKRKYAYHKTHMRHWNIRISYNNNRDVIEQLEAQPNMTQYIIDVVRKDIASKNNK